MSAAWHRPMLHSSCGCLTCTELRASYVRELLTWRHDDAQLQVDPYPIVRAIGQRF